MAFLTRAIIRVFSATISIRTSDKVEINERKLPSDTLYITGMAKPMNVAFKVASGDFVNEIDALFEAGHYASENSIQIAKLKRAAKNLINADATAGWTHLGMVYAVVGNESELKRCFRTARNLHPDQTDLVNMLTTYAYLGFCSVVVELYSEIGSPERGNFPTALMTGLSRGAFQTSASFIAVAKRLQIDMEGLPVTLAEKCAEILRRFDLSDAHVARHLDAAGAVLRERRVFEARIPEILASDVEGFMTGVTMVLYIKCEPSDIASFNFALAQKEYELKVVKHFAFDVVFAAAIGDGE